MTTPHDTEAVFTPIINLSMDGHRVVSADLDLSESFQYLHDVATGEADASPSSQAVPAACAYLDRCRDALEAALSAEVRRMNAALFTAQTGERFALANDDGSYALDVLALEPTPGPVGPDFVLIVGSADPDLNYTAGVQVSRLTRKP